MRSLYSHLYRVLDLFLSSSIDLEIALHTKKTKSAILADIKL